MRKIIVFFIAFLFFIISFIFKRDSYKNINKEIIIQEENTIKVFFNNEIVDMNFEDYVIGVVACEVPASFNIEAIKSMAVAARTFALYKLENNKNYVMKTTVSDQCYISKDKMKKNWKNNYDKYYKKISAAVNETKNQILTYNDEVIISFYFSISNGYTENCENVFAQKLDYLKSVKSSWDSNLNYKEKEVKFKIVDFLNMLSINDNKIKSINFEKYDTGRVKKIIVNGKEFKGTKFRSLLSLRSTDIKIKYDDSYVYITTRGNGHGVGMSQYGANEMAKNGYDYEEILKYYYTDVKIVNKI